MVFLTKGSYLDIDQILAEEEKITSTWNVDAYKLHFLAGKSTKNEFVSNNKEEDSEGEDDEEEEEDDDEIDNEEDAETRQAAKKKKNEMEQKTEDLPANSKTDLPLWLIRSLYVRSFVGIKLPKFFSKQVLAAVAASPENANVHELCPYYYEVGQLLLEYMEQRNENEPNEEEMKNADALRDTLVKTFVRRYGMKLLQAYNTVRKEDLSMFLVKLSLAEKELFDIARKSTNSYAKWKKDQIGSSQLTASEAFKEISSQSGMNGPFGSSFDDEDEGELRSRKRRG